MMSYERAMKFCRKCYAYDKLTGDKVRNYSQLRDAATVTAMLALEAVCSGYELAMRMSKLNNAVPSEEEARHLEFAKELLAACRDCEYMSPKVADILQEIEDGKTETL